MAFAIERVSVGTPRIVATRAFATGVRLSAAITATISWPSANHPKAEEWKIAPKTASKIIFGQASD
jgi:hypothetical protein